MKKYILLSFFLLSYLFDNAQSLQDTNKEIARNFYQDLWFSNNTDRYQQYLADEYIINDIGDEKGLIEKSIEQKEVADFFWANGDMAGEIDYQLADGDIVATRWIWRYTPSTFFGSVFFGETEIPIINAFRFKDGKIVEIWNHRHDIDIPGRQRPFVFKGLLIGLLIALIPLIWALRWSTPLK